MSTQPDFDVLFAIMHAELDTADIGKGGTTVSEYREQLMRDEVKRWHDIVFKQSQEIVLLKKRNAFLFKLSLFTLVVGNLIGFVVWH